MKGRAALVATLQLQFIHRFAGIVQQMPTVCYLYGIRCSMPCPIGIALGPVPHDYNQCLNNRDNVSQEA